MKSRRVGERIQDRHRDLARDETLAAGAELANMTRRLKTRVRQAVVSRLNLRASRLLVEIPENIVRVGEASSVLARAWTLNLRRIFENYFSKGYVVTDVLVGRDGDERRVFYLLEHNPPP